MSINVFELLSNCSVRERKFFFPHFLIIMIDWQMNYRQKIRIIIFSWLKKEKIEIPMNTQARIYSL